MPLPEIQCFDAPVLRKKAKKIQRVNKSVKGTLEEMLQVMRLSNGVGLAAPQIGVSKRLVVIDVGEGPRYLVNPEIVDASIEKESQWEGCLSWPGYIGEVERSARVNVKALDADGREVWIEGEGLLARCLQHEIDHLDGVLFVDRAITINELPAEEDEGAAEPDGGREDAVTQEPADTREEPKDALAGKTVVFMGSPKFAVPSLEALVSRGIKVRLTMTQPDRPFGRKRSPKATPVKEAAEKLGIPVLCCENLKDERVQEQIRAVAPDFIAVVAFGQKVPEEVISVPGLACLNVHPSLLPKYRGGNPISRAIMNGDKATGVSVIYLTERLDAGDLCLQEEVQIGPEETFGELEKKLASTGARCLISAMEDVVLGRASRKEQNDSLATRARHLRPGEDVIEWNAKAEKVHNLVRGLSPEPGAVTSFHGERIKILSSGLTKGKAEDKSENKPGTITEIRGDFAAVACLDKMVLVKIVQPEGKKEMTAKAFLMGRPGGDRSFGNDAKAEKDEKKEGSESCS